MAQVSTHLWYDVGEAERAARFYVDLIPGSALGASYHSPADNPSVAAGALLLVEFTLAGQRFFALNGGPGFAFSPAMSIQVELDTQAEVDRAWDALTADGGRPGRCGWCSDRWGVSWQVVPRLLGELMSSDDRPAAARAMQAMLGMDRIDAAALQRAYDGG